MITITNSNFGSSVAILKDFQSTDICVLNGKITIDPTQQSYKTAQHLEFILPYDFLIKKSAMSTAILMSGAPLYRYGTVLRCWIENGRLCIEKISAWDNFGTYDIYIASAFVTRGYRGLFSNTQQSTIQILNIDGKFAFNTYRCIIKDHFVYFFATFNTFPQSVLGGNNQHTLLLSGFPANVDVEIPLIVNNGSLPTDQIGSRLCPGAFNNGNLTFRFPDGAVNMGSNTSFFNFFAVRGV